MFVKPQSPLPPTHTQLCANQPYPPRKSEESGLPVQTVKGGWVRKRKGRGREKQGCISCQELREFMESLWILINQEKKKKQKTKKAHSSKEICISKERIPSWYWPLRKFIERVSAVLLSEWWYLILVQSTSMNSLSITFLLGPIHAGFFGRNHISTESICPLSSGLLLGTDWTLNLRAFPQGF